MPPRLPANDFIAPQPPQVGLPPAHPAGAKAVREDEFQALSKQVAPLLRALGVNLSDAALASPAKTPGGEAPAPRPGPAHRRGRRRS